MEREENPDNTYAQYVILNSLIKEDIQGIQWDKVNRNSREFRRARLEVSQKEYEKEFSEAARNVEGVISPEKGGMYYDFCQYASALAPRAQYHSTGDFLCSTSKHDVYFSAYDRIHHWNALTSKTSESVVLDLSGHVAPSEPEEYPGNRMEGFTEVQVTKMATWDNLLIVGGVEGDLIVKRLDRPGVSFCFQTTSREGEMESTSAIEIYKHLSGAIHFIVSDGEGNVRVFDTEKFQLLNHFRFPWQVNSTSLRPKNGDMLVVVGDSTEGKLVDPETGMTIAPLPGHTGDSKTAAWHPDGCFFATGSEDRTCRLWDIRNMKTDVVLLKGNMGGINSIRFTSDGQFMAMAEDVDFVHVYDVKSGFGKEQEIEFFGYVSGLSLSPDAESLFISITADTFPNLLMYNRRAECECSSSNS
ncbi:WD40/YVTN repeat-like-containing domain superfamily [Sesbania bispinosa]|nr:WD40/YVTN repeat-like-containing domain superfamily [Sesbania bispinosa]